MHERKAATGAFLRHPDGGQSKKACEMSAPPPINVNTPPYLPSPPISETPPAPYHAATASSEFSAPQSVPQFSVKICE